MTGGDGKETVMTVDEIMSEIHKQYEAGCSNGYGEPQAFVELPNGRCIEIVHEEDGLKAEDQYYSVRLRCSDNEYTSFKKTLGVIGEWNEEDLASTLSEVLKVGYKEVQLDFTGSLSKPEQVSTSEGYIDFKLELNRDMLAVLVSKTDLLQVTGGSLDELVRDYNINVTGSLDANDPTEEITIVVGIANHEEGYYDIEYEPTSEEYLSLYDEINAHAKRVGLTIEDYISEARETGVVPDKFEDFER